MRLVTFLTILSIFLYSCQDNTKEIPASEIFSSMPEGGYEVRVDSSLTISPKITYDYNSSYKWEENNEVIWSSKDYTLTPDELAYHEYKFTVENDRGSDEATFIVQSLYISDFDDLTLDKDSFWTAPNDETTFKSGIITFENSGKPAGNDWNGFTYSNLRGNQSPDSLDYLSSYTVPYTDSIFAVLKQDSAMTPSYLSLDPDVEHKFKSLIVTPTYGTYNAVRNGTDNSKKFGGENGNDKDFLKLLLTGIYSNGGRTLTYEYFIADYTSDDNRNNYVLSVWDTIPLQILGLVNKIELQLVSTDLSDDGLYMKTPASICIDDIKIIE